MDDERLIKRIKKDKTFFDRIYKENYQKIFNFIYSKIQNRENSEDIASLVFEKAFKGIDTFQWEGVSIESWLYRIARNALIDYYRYEGRRKKDISINSKDVANENSEIQDSISDNEPFIEDVLARSDEEIKLYKIIRLFDEKDQYMIYYKYFEDLTNKEIAVIMDMTETNVSTKLMRLRSKIKKEIEKQHIK